MDAAISPRELQTQLNGAQPPLVIDVRRTPAYRGANSLIAGALRRDPASVAEWSRSLPRARSVVVYCVHGHEVSLNPATRWVTRERPKIDRIACPWLVTRFVDPDAEFLYVPAADVKRIAAERNAEPYDVADAAFGHVGEQCSFDAFIKAYRLSEPALDRLATIVRGADTGALQLAPQSAGLLAISQGLSRNFTDDHAMLKQGMVMYDALYAWCQEGLDATSMWQPAA